MAGAEAAQVAQQDAALDGGGDQQAIALSSERILACKPHRRSRQRESATRLAQPSPSLLVQKP
jgi:hypothetical protein